MALDKIPAGSVVGQRAPVNRMFKAPAYVRATKPHCQGLCRPEVRVVCLSGSKQRACHLKAQSCWKGGAQCSVPGVGTATGAAPITNLRPALLGPGQQRETGASLSFQKQDTADEHLVLAPESWRVVETTSLAGQFRPT